MLVRIVQRSLKGKIIKGFTLQNINFQRRARSKGKQEGNKDCNRKTEIKRKWVSDMNMVDFELNSDYQNFKLLIPGIYDLF